MEEKGQPEMVESSAETLGPKHKARHLTDLEREIWEIKRKMDGREN